MDKFVRLSAILVSVALASFAMGQKTDLHLVATNAGHEIGFYYPQHLNLSERVPKGWTSTFVLSADAMFGTLEFGGRKLPVAVNFFNSQPSELLVDLTGRGDFINAASFPFAVKGSGANAYYTGSADLPSEVGGGAMLGIKFYKFASGTVHGNSMKGVLLYYADYALVGTAEFGGKKYKAALLDASCRGTFSIPPEPAAPKSIPVVDFLVDRNRDGRFSGPPENFNAQNPFNISGKSYVVNVDAKGTGVVLKPSAKAVAEIKPIPITTVGNKVIAFTATDRDGKVVHFPGDYKGKIVLLDFWATWCGPCLAEVPNVVKQYATYHDQGFEVLGISLDNDKTIKNMTKVMGEKGMTWDEVADGKYWDAAVAKLYGIEAVPASFIVDGDTGRIVAENEAIRGKALALAIEKALAQRKVAASK